MYVFSNSQLLIYHEGIRVHYNVSSNRVLSQVLSKLWMCFEFVYKYHQNIINFYLMSFVHWAPSTFRYNMYCIDWHKTRILGHFSGLYSRFGYHNLYSCCDLFVISDVIESSQCYLIVMLPTKSGRCNLMTYFSTNKYKQSLFLNIVFIFLYA